MHACPGEFDTWRADIRFDPNQLASSQVSVEIDLASVNTQDAERDATLHSAEWFDVGNRPTATFAASDFATGANGGFVAKSTLSIKGASTPVTFEFEIDDQGVLTGRATLDRLQLAVGTGEWTDTTWVGQEVQVGVRVARTTANGGTP